jgi:cation transport ATPase
LWWFCIGAVAGYIAVRTTAMADNSAVAKMARLVEEAQNSRSKTQRLIDTCAKYYTPGKPYIRDYSCYSFAFLDAYYCK